MVKVAWLAAAHAAIHRFRGPVACSGRPLGPRGEPSLRGCRTEAAAAVWCLPKAAHSAASDHLGRAGPVEPQLPIRGGRD
eukprot:scaffold108117_cov48-Phaeocystis_antarctica.AAC.4